MNPTAMPGVERETPPIAVAARTEAVNGRKNDRGLHGYHGYGGAFPDLPIREIRDIRGSERSGSNPLPQVSTTQGAAVAPLALAFGTTACLLLAIYLGSARFRHLDTALSGYLAATIVSCFALTYRVVAFWSRPASAFYARILFNALKHPRQATRMLRAGARDVAAQSFIRKRGLMRWLAHMSLSWGTMIAFAVTLPLVWGWLHFEAAGDRHYVALFAGVPTLRFDVGGVAGWLMFHVLSVAAVAVIGGCAYFLRQRWLQGATAALHIGPLLLLVGVAGSGLLLIPAAAAEARWVLPAAQMIHQASVVALLLALAFSKLIHVFIRPLHVGVQLLRATSSESTHCRSCATAIVAAAQFAAVQTALAARGFQFAGYQDLCPACRRRNLATHHGALAGDVRWQALTPNGAMHG